uniref:Uncharacterized protein n=1 Tax=Micrurus corallinus TaxID=54390 RepID=A0A2D4GRH8_MICCO
MQVIPLPPEISKQHLRGDEHAEVSKNQSKITCNSMLEWQVCPQDRIKCSNNLDFILFVNNFAAVDLILIGTIWCLFGDTKILFEDNHSCIFLRQVCFKKQKLIGRHCNSSCKASLN